jgi:hypothetical protein
MLTGVAAALHHLRRLRQNTVTLELGTACTGFLSALWSAQMPLPQVGVVLVMAVEAPSRYLHLQAGPVGENAALFGDDYLVRRAVFCARGHLRCLRNREWHRINNSRYHNHRGEDRRG